MLLPQIRSLAPLEELQGATALEELYVASNKVGSGNRPGHEEGKGFATLLPVWLFHAAGNKVGTENEGQGGKGLCSPAAHSAVPFGRQQSICAASSTF